MLKRQRASSPLPSPPSVPQGPSSEDVINIRDLKRRRIAPPSLDGQKRGWDSQSLEDENEEEYVESDGHDERDEVGLLQSSNVEYAAVNTQIHTIASSLYPQFPVDKSREIYPPETQITSESVRVYEHYEDANRSLASAFLSRRQHPPSQP